MIVASPQSIALLDWDGSIRDSFTIRYWVRYLAQHHIVPPESVDAIEAAHQSFSEGRFTHDSFVDATSEIYARLLRTLSADRILGTISPFLRQDLAHLHSFSRRLLSYLRTKDIDIVVISGTPIEILSAYGKMFGFRRVYGLELEIFRGHYTGAITQNPGTTQSKDRIVKCLRNESHVRLAIGNSSSDLPLFDAAPINVVVNNSELQTKGNSFVVSSDESEAVQLFEFLDSELR